MTSKHWLVTLLSLISVACGAASEPGAGGDSETHFLELCESECSAGLDCICGVCTVVCDPAQSCSSLHSGAICRLPDGSDREMDCDEESRPSICDVTCTDDGDCESLGDGYQCLAGACRLADCVYDGRGYSAGESFPSTDGCNSCSCEAGGDVACTLRACGDPPGGCMYDGAQYAPGDSFPSSDGCNSCGCGEDGNVFCTTRDCSDPPTCEADGMSYAPGDTFPAPDGCNTCICQSDGTAACTDAACNGPGTPCEFDGMTYQPGETVAVDCNTCACGSDGRMACTLIACGPSLCELPFEAGPCEALFPVFWFNSTSGRCEPATYGGCEGNENRFDTLAECRATCGGGSVCSLPFDSGPCDAAIPVIYFNNETGQCEPATYGGCEGNGNRFETVAECEASCAGGIACEVNGVVYPHGTTAARDLCDTNDCTCNNGELGACTRIACDPGCADDEIVSTECAQCGPDDGCEVMRTACLRTCTEESDCADLGKFCFNGRCANVCG